MDYQLPAGTPMTPQLLGKIIEYHQAHTVPRMQRLERYYRNNNANGQQYPLSDGSLDGGRTADGKPDNRVRHPYAWYITNIMTGYFAGEPVQYTCDAAPRTPAGLIGVDHRRETDGNEPPLLQRIKAINAYNDEAAHNMRLATDASKQGRAAEILYIDRYGEIRFRRLPPDSAIRVYDDTLDAELLYGIRLYVQWDILTGAETLHAEVYDAAACMHYVCRDAAWQQAGEPSPHIFGMVPINIYQNNPDEIGDYELVTTLIDGYDKAAAESLNALDYFADAYLVLKGVDVDEDDVKAAKRNRVFALPSDGGAGFLTKDGQDSFTALKERTDKDIHKFAMCPALTDEDFAANASGVAIKYKLMGTETMAGIKERLYREGLQRRIELICNALAVKGERYDWRTITLKFARNLPANLTEMADVLAKIGNLLSEETQVGLLPIDVDPKAEAARKAAEAESGYSIPMDGSDT